MILFPPLTTWLKNLSFILPRSFHFMIHDRWANVLFLHWRIPNHLEETLKECTHPFLLDRYDGSLWMGLVLLTEQNVGPILGRIEWTCVTHHGANFRTYVSGLDRVGEKINSVVRDTKDIAQRPQQHGIHFSSLECDDEFTSFGANMFGMPYRVARMMRAYHVDGMADTGHQGKNAETVSTRLADELSCSTIGKHNHSTRVKRYRLRSERLKSGVPSFFRMLFYTFAWFARVLHFTKLVSDSNDNVINPHNKNNEKKKNSWCMLDFPRTAMDPDIFTVDCSWSCCENIPKHNSAEKVELPPLTNDKRRVDDGFSKWVMERYAVYTRKYGLNWKGQVEHRPWPIEEVRLEHLHISGVDSYEPRSMRPIIQYVAKNSPDSVLFSPGVGPVRFNMLQPV